MEAMLRIYYLASQNSRLRIYYLASQNLLSYGVASQNLLSKGSGVPRNMKECVSAYNKYLKLVCEPPVVENLALAHF
jgi:hypothetical protein